MSKRKYTKRNQEYWESKANGKLNPENKEDKGEHSNSEKRGRVTLRDLQYGDGKATLEDFKALDKLLCAKQSNAFGTLSEEVFQEKIGIMNLSDMQSLAVSVGVHPSGNRTTLKNKLLREFRAKVGGKGNRIQVTKPIVDPNSERGKRIAKMMSHG